jgi:hypothetical protein
MATIYVDASRPDDTGNGLTPAAAKRTIRGGRLALIPAGGGTLFVRRGYCYDPLNGSFFNVQGNMGSSLITTYGSGDTPIWDGLTYEPAGASGWTYIAGSGGAWKKTFGNFYVRRVFSASQNNGILTTQRTVGPGLRRVVVGGVQTTTTSNPSEADIVTALQTYSTSHHWSPGGAATGFALYIWTGSDSIDPPTFYQGLAFIQANGSTVGSVHGVELVNPQSSVRIENQIVRGASGNGFRLNVSNVGTADSPGFEVVDCGATHVWLGAVSVFGLAAASATHRVKGGFCRRVTGYANYAAQEGEGVELENAFSGACDMFLIADRVDNFTIEYCNAIDAGHNGFALGSFFSGESAAIPTNLTVKDSFASYATTHPYGRGFLATRGTNLRYERMRIVGQNVRSQAQGDTLVRDSKWTGCRPSVRKPGTDQWIGTEAYVADNFSGLGATVRYIPVEPSNVRILNNYAEGDFPNQAVTWETFSNLFGVTNTWASGAVTLANNVVIGGSTVLRAQKQAAGNAATIPNDNVVRNNDFYKAGQPSAGRVSWLGTSHTVNSAPGFTGNLEVDPQLTTGGKPLPTSPLIGAGVHYGYRRDLDKVQRPKPPAIGAYDVAPFVGYKAP